MTVLTLGISRLVGGLRIVVDEVTLGDDVQMAVDLVVGIEPGVEHGDQNARPVQSLVVELVDLYLLELALGFPVVQNASSRHRPVLAVSGGHVGHALRATPDRTCLAHERQGRDHRRLLAVGEHGHRVQPPAPRDDFHAGRGHAFHVASGHRDVVDVDIEADLGAPPERALRQLRTKRVYRTLFLCSRESLVCEEDP